MKGKNREKKISILNRNVLQSKCGKRKYVLGWVTVKEGSGHTVNGHRLL